MDVQLFIQQWDMTVSAGKREQLKKELTIYINGLLLNDFEGLVQLLYRIDIQEQKLKSILADYKTTDAGELIADLLIKRQEEKLAFRQSFPPANNSSEDERW